MKRTYFALCAGLILLTFPARAVSFWEGTAVASSYGEFPSAGLYAACSSFPRNSVVEVTNLENGKTVQVLVTRSLDNPGVFIALSPEAASALLIQIGMVARVKVALPQTGANNLLRADAPGLSQDPDLNPQALVERERQKEDSDLSAVPSAQVAAAEPEIKPETKPETKPEVKPAQTSMGVSKPETIEAQRQQAPDDNSLAVKPKDLPDTPIGEKTPVAVEARTDSDVKATAQENVKPETLARTAVSREPGAEEPSYALSSPELEAEKEALAVSAQIYERTAMAQPEGAEVSLDLDDPALDSRGKPESALTRIEPPESSGKVAVSMASPELDGTAAESAEAITMAKKGGLMPGQPEISALDLPAVREEQKEGAEVSERLVVIKKATPMTDLSGLALDDPRLLDETEGTEEGGEGVAYEDPGYEEPEDTELLSADERLLASKVSPADTELALRDPELESESEADIVYEEPEDTELLSADERIMAGKRNPAEADLALADPELGTPPQDSSALSSVDERLTAAKRKAPAVSFSIPDPETTEISLAKTEENAPPEALEGLTKPKGKTPSKMAVALAKPELAPEEKATGVEGAHDILTLGKPSAEIAIEEQKPEVKVEEKPATQEPTAKVETVKPEIVESFRKGAEALVALNARRMDGLSKGIYYVQVGVYRSGQGAAQAVKGLTPEYPLSYQEVEAKESLFYRVFVGPLKKDESGIVLYRLKSMGFKDAFVRKGD